MKFIIRLMLEKHVIPYEKKEVYEYGLECFILKIIHLFTYLLIAVCLHSLLQFILLGFVFGALRKHAGGYHANTRLGCYLFSCIIVTGFLLTSHIYLSWVINKIVIIISNLIIWKYAPVVNGNMELDEWEKLYHRRKSIQILIIWDVVFIICCLSKIELIYNIIMKSCLLMSSILILGKLKIYFISNKLKNWV